MSCAPTPEKRRSHASMYDQRLPNRENHRQLEGVSAPPAINIRAHRNKRNMPLMDCAIRLILVD
jgi:hypothetical protein